MTHAVGIGLSGNLTDDSGDYILLQTTVVTTYCYKHVMSIKTKESLGHMLYGHCNFTAQTYTEAHIDLSSWVIDTLCCILADGSYRPDLRKGTLIWR